MGRSPLTLDTREPLPTWSWNRQPPLFVKRRVNRVRTIPFNGRSCNESLPEGVVDGAARVNGEEELTYRAILENGADE
jgi:hypothetical protein